MLQDWDNQEGDAEDTFEESQLFCPKRNSCCHNGKAICENMNQHLSPQYCKE